MIRHGRIYASALAKYVHANGLRHQATGHVREAEMRYDRAFPQGRCTIEPPPDGRLRLISPDESQCIQVPPETEGRLFRFTESPL